MNKECKYLYACLSAIDGMTSKGYHLFGIKIDGKWETIPWSEIHDWIAEQIKTELDSIKGEKEIWRKSYVDVSELFITQQF